MTLLQRHLFRGLLASWLSVTAVLVAILVFSQLPITLNRAALHEIQPGILAKFVFWVSVANLPAVLPVTVLLATVLAYGRFGSDGELSAMRTSGCAPTFLLVPILWLAVPVMALQAFIALYFAPQSLCNAAMERGMAARTAALAPIAAGKFQSYGPGVVLFVESVSSDGRLQNVFIKRDAAEAVEVIVAARGTVQPRPSDNVIRISLDAGKRYEGVPGSAAYRLVSFGNYEANLPLPVIQSSCNRADARPSVELFTSDDPKWRAEFNNRLALPLMVLILALLALSLSTTKPREGPYARLPFALLVFFVYSFASIGLTTYSGRQPTTGPIAFWSLHVGVTLLGLFWLWRAQFRGGAR